MRSRQRLVLDRLETAWSRLGATIVAAAALAACAGVRSPELAPGSAAAHVPHEQLANGDAIVVVRDYVDEFKLDGGTVHKRVRWAWNYSRGLTQELRSNLDGSELVVIDHPRLTLRATADELQYAVSLVRDDPRFAGRVTPELQFDSGFSYREPGNPACYLHSRCIHVIASRDAGAHIVIHAIVDLMQGTIVDPDYDPRMTGIADPPGKGE
ncbi:MAG: hypothetical protein KA911_01600 [Xanthomonadales bacterium]|nr:hypothetical protein [Xanthomonadales bacterium]MBP6690900.1 hypothetical protein [Xanthomonadales bacterium]MBP7417267.1 hypothetical protein [Xanthomonadales bacterium]MBP8176150.1 hypothetical protein [Xanthomonadales bacterium]HQX24230.1 hypothetical protein [Pseudomonadota bacterium]